MKKVKSSLISPQSCALILTKSSSKLCPNSLPTQANAAYILSEEDSGLHYTNIKKKLYTPIKIDEAQYQEMKQRLLPSENIITESPTEILASLSSNQLGIITNITWHYHLPKLTPADILEIFQKYHFKNNFDLAHELNGIQTFNNLSCAVHQDSYEFKSRKKILTRIINELTKLKKKISTTSIYDKNNIDKALSEYENNIQDPMFKKTAGLSMIKLENLLHALIGYNEECSKKVIQTISETSTKILSYLKECHKLKYKLHHLLWESDFTKQNLTLAQQDPLFTDKVEDLLEATISAFSTYSKTCENHPHGKPTGSIPQSTIFKLATIYHEGTGKQARCWWDPTEKTGPEGYYGDFYNFLIELRPLLKKHFLINLGTDQSIGKYASEIQHTKKLCE